MTGKIPASGIVRWLAVLPPGIRSFKALRGLPTPLISILGPALGSAFLIPHPWIGALLWIAVFQDTRYAAFALLGVVVAEIICRVFQIRDTSPVEGSLKANAVLAAIAAAWLTGSGDIPLQTQIVVTLGSAITATVVTAAVMKALSNVDLPALVLGYCLVAVLLFAIFPYWTYSATSAMEWWPVPVNLSEWVVTFFRTLGALLFSPTLLVGFIVVTAVLLWSRMAFAAGLTGWIAGILMAIALNQQGVIFYWMPTAYNFFLTGMALGAVFFLPGRTSLIMAAAGGCGAALVAVGLQHLFPATALGYLPVVSVVTIWAGIYALTLNQDQTIVRRNQATNLPPEEAWWRAAYWNQRSGHEGPFLLVPISGPTQIGQGVDGQFSHAGAWRYALDFQRPDLPGQPRRRDADGAASWNPPVLAPASGIVERVRNDVADNPLGICNYAENWGNYVIIQLDQGNWALLAHLQQGSVAVKPGMRVEIGSYLGMVGNSGRSPIPHLHLQAQKSPRLGAPSMPFRLANFLSATDAEKPLLQWHPSALPDQGTVVAPALTNPRVLPILTSGAPGSAIWSVETDGIIPRPFRKLHSESATRITITFDTGGRHLFRSSAGGALISNTDPDAWRVLELQTGTPPLLTLLALAAPSIPYAAVTGMKWEELAPVTPRSGLSLSSYLADPFVNVHCECISAPDGGQDSPLIIETHLETPWHWLPSRLTCQFDRLRGPVRLEAFFQTGSLEYSLLSFEPGLPLNRE